MELQTQPDIFSPDTFNVQPEFSLSKVNKQDLDKIVEECMEKVRSWEKRINPMLQEYQIFSDSWRMKPRTGSKKPLGLHNSKSGETHRAVETLATVWLRMLTASDRYFEAVNEGINPLTGATATPQELYDVEEVLERQMQWAHFKDKLIRSLRSNALMGTMIVEEPFVSLPYGDGEKSREYTDCVLRPLILTAFDTSVFDIEFSDFMATVDFPTKWRLLNWASSDDQFWDKKALEDYIKANDTPTSQRNVKSNTGAWGRVLESKTRAGYTEVDTNVFEFINYHGRIETDNSVIRDLWNFLGRQDDPKYSDFTVGILEGQLCVKLHPTQYGTWKSRFKTATFKNFELEPYGYGVGRIGRRNQRELDVTQSRSSDLLTFAQYGINLVSKYAGLKNSQLNIKPMAFIEIEDVNQMKQLTPDMNALVQALAMMAMQKEDFRNTVGAQTNLQAQLTKASATESAIAQTEAIRGAGVIAEIIADTFLREHIEQCYINDLNYLDSPIWAGLTGDDLPRPYTKDNLPTNVGFKIKVTTDKDFRPERLQRLVEALQMCTSIRNVVPPSINAVTPLFEEWFRSMGINPRLLRTPQNPLDTMAQNFKFAQSQGLPNQVGAEQGGEQAGAANIQNTPMGPVPTSPLGATPGAI